LWECERLGVLSKSCSVYSQLLFAKDKCLDQHNDPDQVEGANQCPLDVGPLENPNADWDGEEESQAVVRSFRKDSLF